MALSDILSRFRQSDAEYDEEGYEDLLNPNQPQALIILPTRELTKQVAQDLRDAAKYLSTRIVEIYGGVAFEPQIEALTRCADIVVGTPGRLIDLLRKGHLHLSGVETVVLDEADEMLDLGFLPDVETLLARVPENRHTMLFSATMPGPVVALARRPADPHPRAGPRRPEPDRQHGQAGHLPRSRHEQGGGRRPHPPGRGSRSHRHLLPHQAHRRPPRRGSDRPRLRGRRTARRPGPGRPRAGAARVP